MWNIIPLDLDIKKKNYNFIEINQADDVCFNVKLYSNGQPLSLVDGEDTIIINYANANGTVTGDSSIGKTMSKSGAMVYLPRNCTNSAGTAHMQITINTNKLYNANKQTTSFPLDIKIKQSVVDGKQVSANVNSMVDAINSANIKGQQTIKNIEDTAKKYPVSSQLYSDVEDLKVREYGAENLIRDSGFNGSIGDGFPWKMANNVTNYEIIYAPSLRGGNYIKITSSTGQPGILQTISIGNESKNCYTVSLKAYGTKGNIVYISLHGVETKSYTFKNTNVWENIVVTFDKNVSNWVDKQIIIFGTKKNTLLLADIALWEGKNSFTFKHNSKDCLYDRIRISGKDVLKINYSGKYAGVNCINNPFGDTVSWAYYDIEVHSSTYKKIIARSYHSSLEYVNTMNNGTWSGWVNKNNLASYTQDSTHRFTTDTEKGVWNASVYSETKAISNGNTIKVAMKYPACKHIKITFTITNKTNISDFYVKVNDTMLIRQETGGSSILEILDFYRYENNNWMYINNGFIKATNGGDYKINEHDVMSNLGNLNNVLLQCKNSSDTFNGVTAFVEYYK